MLEDPTSKRIFSVCRQTQLDEQLLESGRLIEASKSLTDWLEKCEEALSDKHPLRGDQDTVSSLIEQHKVTMTQSWVIVSVDCDH